MHFLLRWPSWLGRQTHNLEVGGSDPSRSIFPVDFCCSCDDRDPSFVYAVNTSEISCRNFLIFSTRQVIPVYAVNTSEISCRNFLICSTDRYGRRTNYSSEQWRIRIRISPTMPCRTFLPRQILRRSGYGKPAPGRRHLLPGCGKPEG